MSADDETEQTTETIKEVLLDAFGELRRIEHLAWAADQLLLHNTDNRVSDIELSDRVSSLIDLSGDLARKLGHKMEEAAMAIS